MKKGGPFSTVAYRRSAREVLWEVCGGVLLWAFNLLLFSKGFSNLLFNQWSGLWGNEDGTGSTCGVQQQVGQERYWAKQVAT